MKTLRILPILFLAFLFNPAYSQSDDQQPTIYTVVDFIKIKPGMGSDYIKLEEAWKKIHKKRMDNNEMLNWAVYHAATNVGSDYEYQYAAVNIFQGNKQLAGYYGGHNLDDYADVLTKEDMALIKRTGEIRELVREEVYVLLDQRKEDVLFPEVQWLQFLTLNEGHSIADFMKVEKRLGGQLDNEMIKNGDLLNTQIYQRRLPSGTNAKFNFVRVFAYNDAEHLLEFPKKYGATRAKLNPGFAGLPAKFGNVSLYKEEMWRKVMCGCD